jgi:hypothetical protein
VLHLWSDVLLARVLVKEWIAKTVVVPALCWPINDATKARSGPQFVGHGPTT